MTIRERLLAGALLLTAGAVAVQGTSVHVFVLLPLGLLAHVVGWLLVPGDLWRRIVAGSVSTLSMLALLSGPSALWLAAVPLAGWILARRRHPLAYLVVAVPLAVGVGLGLLADGYAGMATGAAVQVAVVVASAWAGAGIERLARRGRPRRPRPVGP